MFLDHAYSLRKLKHNTQSKMQKTQNNTVKLTPPDDIAIISINNKLEEIDGYNQYIYSVPDSIDSHDSDAIDLDANIANVRDTDDAPDVSEIDYKPETNNKVHYSAPKVIKNIKSTKSHLYIAAPGRLGNQLFQYAVGYSLAILQNRTAVLQSFTAMEIQRLFQVQPSVEVGNIPPGLPLVEEEGAGIFTPMLTRLPNRDLTICCYFQSWRYLDKVFVRKIFKPKQGLLHKAREILHELTGNYKALSKQKYRIDLSHTSLVYVGLHIRQTDYTVESSIDKGYRAAPLKYILKSMAYYENAFSNVVFIACSDDKKWVQENLSWKSNLLVAPGSSDEVDFVTLTQCNHTIITTGTFGWWAAYLTNGNVTYYADWLAKDSEIGRVYKAKDYFPQQWIPLSV